MWRKFTIWNNRRILVNKDIAELYGLSDRDLMDIGISRGNIRAIAETRPYET